MNFGDFVDNSSSSVGGDRFVHNNKNILPYSNTATNNMANGTIAQSIFSSPGLSMALQTNMEGGGGGHGEMMTRMRSREDEIESRSESDNNGGASDDDLDASDTKLPRRKKRYHRHTPQQIQELESLFKECPHPDEKQRLELSKRLNLEIRQVKFWFQNRRTQMKTQIERHENSILRNDNDKLRVENMSIREAMRNPICTNCGGPALIGDISIEEQHLKIENARLKDELDRVCGLASKFIGRPIPSPMPNSSLELGVGSNGFSAMNNIIPDFGSGTSSNLSVVAPMSRPVTGVTGTERSMLLELALAAMDELIKMVQSDESIWLKNFEGSNKEVLNQEEYLRTFSPCIGMKPNGFVTEASRESGIVIINSLALVETLMDSNRWADMFPCVVARTSVTEVLCSGVGGTRNGALQLMYAELQVLSPFVPVREVNFLRFCKQHAEGVWAVVDVSIETIRENSGLQTYVSCRRLPSGCVVQDMPNGYSKVTWVEHSEYDENAIHPLYRSLISVGLGFGAQRWVATLQRQCECLAILMSSAGLARDNSAITAGGRRSMLKLAQRMTDNFCAGVCASTVYKWNKLSASNVDEGIRVMTRKSIDDPGEPPGVVLSAATSVWLPVSSQRLFDFIRDERLRSEWDILSNGGPMQEMAHIAKGQDHGNCVSLLRATAMNANQSSMLILQETCIDASGSLIVYAPVDIPAMHVVMNGGDSAYVALLPSGFSIVPDGRGSYGSNNGQATTRASGKNDGSLLTVAFQILVNSLPTGKLTVESVETVNNLISCTVQKIKAALQSEI